MISHADQLARLRPLIEGGIPLPLDLGSWVLLQLTAEVSADYTRLKRDQHLRRAGDLVGGSCNARATAILRHAAQLERVWRFHSTMPPDLGTFTGEIRAALLIGRLPGPRHLRSILSRARVATPGGEGWQSAG